MAEELLSTRQSEVLHLVAHGLTNPEIAVRLGVSESTVKTHLDLVFVKLGVHDRAAAVHAGHRAGILT